MTTLSTAKPRCAKIRTSISGLGVRSSNATKPARIASPPARQAQVASELQPHWPACCRPRIVRPIPAETSRAPDVDRCRPSLVHRSSPPGQRERDQRHGHVDQEDRAPCPGEEEAARDRADRCETACDPEEESERLPALARFERVEDDRQRRREEQCAEGSD